MTVTPMHSSHGFSQTAARQNLIIHDDKRDIAYQRNIFKRFMMHEKLTALREELAAEKAARNRGRGRGCNPGYTPKKVGLAKSRILGKLAGKEADDEADDIMGDMAYHERKGDSTKARK